MHFLDSIIGDYKHLDHTLYAFLEDLDGALYMFHHLNTKAYGAHRLDFVVGHREHLDLVLDTFRNVDASYIHPLFSTVSEVNSACPLTFIYLFSLPSKNGVGQLAEIDLRRLLALAKQKSLGSRSEIDFFFSVLHYPCTWLYLLEEYD